MLTMNNELPTPKYSKLWVKYKIWGGFKKKFDQLFLHLEIFFRCAPGLWPSAQLYILVLSLSP